MPWPAGGVLHGPFQRQDKFLQHRWTRTNVTDKRKAGGALQYVAKKSVRCADGSRKDVLGGTQKVDGFWAFLRRLIGRSSVATGKAPDESPRA
eukprot:7641452-Lingulodinium_polyedra.AAC.1